jgi:hypothetical protein
VLYSTIKRREGPVEALQRSATECHTRRDDFGSEVTETSQCAALVDVADRAVFPLPGTDALFEGGVIELALVVELVEKGLGLAKRRVQTVSERATAPYLIGHARNVRPRCDTP